MKAMLATTAFLAIVLMLSVCVCQVKGNTQCQLYTATLDDQRRDKYHWEYVTHLKKKTQTKSIDEYVDWIGNGTVDGQSIYFEGSIHKASANSDNPAFRAVFMRNRLAAFLSKEMQKAASFRFLWLLKDWPHGNTGEGGKVPNYTLASGDNCAGFNEVVPFRAEDVEGVLVFQLRVDWQAKV